MNGTITSPCSVSVTGTATGEWNSATLRVLRPSGTSIDIDGTCDAGDDVTELSAVAQIDTPGRWLFQWLVGVEGEQTGSDLLAVAVDVGLDAPEEDS